MHTAQSNIHTPPFFNHVKILPDPVLYVKIHFKFILSSVFMYYEWPPSPRSPFQNPVCNSTISHRYTRPSHYFLLANFITRIKLDHVYKSRNSSFSSSSGPLLVIPIRHAYLPNTSSRITPVSVPSRLSCYCVRKNTLKILDCI